jgi:acetyl-CoA C-acetyltransferase
VHDCFTITELLNYEDLGFCKKGEGANFIRDGLAAADGPLPVNPSGGLKSFGHPIGATGCRMIGEITRQLQGRAEGVQVADPELGLAHNLGGPGAVCSVTILGRQ